MAAPQKFEFEGHGGDPLAGRLDMPEGDHLATALFAHCFTCGKDIAAARRIAQRLTSAGIAVLRFDFTGLGHSGGEFANTTFTSNADDLVRAAEALSRRNMAPALLIGHSLGGAAVLKAAGQIDSVRAVVTIGAPYEPGHVAHQFGDAVTEIEAEGVAEVSLAGRPFRIGREFLDDISGASLKPAIETLDRALLVMHAPRDAIVGIDNATRIFMAAKHPKSFVTLDDADHLVSRGRDAEYVADVISAWAARYLDLQPAEPPEGAPEGVVRVSEADPNGFLQDIAAGPKHQLLADEPESFGGKDRGLTPYQFLSAGLGACTSMTVRMYARRKKWPLEHVSVEIMHDKAHAEEAEHPGGGKIDHFTRVLTLQGDLDEEQRGRLLEIADKCPVHKTLSGNSQISTRLAD